MKKFLTYIGVAIVGIWGLSSMYNSDSSSTDSSSNFAVPDYEADFYDESNYEAERSYDEYGDYDCDDFYSQWEAQDFFESEGGTYDDYHNLDGDEDGYACESL